MKALQATDFKWPYVCSVCLGCPASDTRDLGEKKKKKTEERQRGCSRALLAGARAPRFKSLGSLAARWRARTWVQVLLLARWGMRQDVADAWARCGFSVAPAEDFPDWWGVAFVYLWGVAWRH